MNIQDMASKKNITLALAALIIFAGFMFISYSMTSQVVEKQTQKLEEVLTEGCQFDGFRIAPGSEVTSYRFRQARGDECSQFVSKVQCLNGELRNEAGYQYRTCIANSQLELYNSDEKLSVGDFLISRRDQNKNRYYTATKDEGIKVWATSLNMMAHLNAYRLNKDITYIDILVDHIDTLVAHTDEALGVSDAGRGGKEVFGWGDRGLYSGTQNHVYMTYNGLLTFPIAHMMYEIKQNPVLMEKYGDRFPEWRALIDQAMSQFKDETRMIAGDDGTVDQDQLYYVHAEINDCSNPRNKKKCEDSDKLDFRPLPFNMQHSFAHTMLALRKVYPEENLYDKELKAIINYFNQYVKKDFYDDDLLVWPYRPDRTWVEDASHAGVTVQFLVEAHEQGYIDDQSMKRLVSTFVNFMSAHSRNIDGSGGEAVGTQEKVCDYWMYLAEFDSRVWHQCQSTYNNRNLQFDANEKILMQLFAPESN